MEEIIAINFGKSITIGYDVNGEKTIIRDKEKIFKLDYLIKMDEKIDIDVHEIIESIISEKYEILEKGIKIHNDNEIYKIEILSSKTVYLLDNILINLFEKIKNNVKKLVDKLLKKTIIIFNYLPYELRLIFHRAALISGIEIINFIDLNKSIRYFLECGKKVNDNPVAIIKVDEKIEISIFAEKDIQRIFNNTLSKEEIDLDNLALNEGINEFDCQNKNISNIINIIKKLTIKAYGINEVSFNKIYIYNNSENEELNKISIFGALYSNNFPKSKEGTIIFNFIDFEDDYFLKQLTIMKNIYKINQKRLEIMITDNDIPFENCYYKNIRIYFADKNNNLKDIILTVHYDQKNYYCCSKDIEIANSSEFVFYKNYPKITINDKYNVEIEEKFEEKQIFKRINILNVDREKIKLNEKPLFFYDSSDKKTKINIHEDALFPDILFLIGQNLNILSFFNKNIIYKQSIIEDKSKKELLKLLQGIEFIEKDNSLENLKKYEKELNAVISNLNINYNYNMFKRYFYSKIKNFNRYDADLLIKYGKYLILKNVFIDENNILDFNELNYKKYKKINDSLNEFYNKCKLIEKDFLQTAKLYNTACHMIIDFLEVDNELKKDILFDIIQFENDNIYKEANHNNIDLILKLTKNSFLYPYFLQFNSSFDNSENIIYAREKIETFKVAMLTLNQIKLDLLKSLPKYGIRMFFDTKYFASSVLSTGITIYNEKKLFGQFLEKEELKSINDNKYIKRVKLSFIQKYERFSHYKKTLNKTEENFLDSPRGIINFEGDKIFILSSELSPEKGELGESLEYIMTNGEQNLIDTILNLKEEIDLKELYNNDLFLDNNNTNLIKKLKEIQDLTENHGNSSEKNIPFKKSKNDFDSITKDKKVENNYKIDAEFLKEKIRKIESNPDKKYTFEKNTIQDLLSLNNKK